MQSRRATTTELNARRILQVRWVVPLLAACVVACGDEPSGMMPIGTAGMGAPSAGATAGSTGSAGTSTNAGAGGTATTTGSSAAGSGAAGSTVAGRSGAAGAGAAGSPANPGRGAAGTSPADQAGAPASAAGRGGSGGAAAGSSGSAGASSQSFAPCPAAGEPCKILPLGDSITYGIGYNGGYRVELFRKAHAASQTITFTGSLSNGPNMVDGVTFPKNNEGHSGWKINQLLPLIPNPALQQKPNIILLMIGTNDIAQSDDIANAPKRLGALLDLLIMNVPDALIVVAKLTPLSSGGNAVQTYNAAIPAIVEARATAGKHVVLVDMFTGFAVSMLGDGVHPNQQGYEHMAGIWYTAIAGVLH